ncbi:IS5/IS1182 family transposase, partial [Acinetobacter baumannii]|nr:IS5/IS1182 family transposase [Acinetobacter baumannii]
QKQWKRDIGYHRRSRIEAKMFALKQKQWKRDIGYHRRSRIEAKMFALKRLGQGVSSRCFNRQVVDLQIRVDILNKFTQLGTAKTVAVA